MRPLVRTLLAVAVLHVAALTPTVTAAQGVSAAKPALPPAAFATPAIGTTFEFDGFSSRLDRVDGYRMRFTDQAGATGQLLAHFITDNPDSPLTVPSGALQRLFPLREGRTADFVVSRGPLQWRMQMSVVGTERVVVPAGTFDTYAVQVIETPKRTDRPQQAATRISMFWYAPSINWVVRLRTETTSPDGRTSSRRSQLMRVVPPRGG